MDEASEGREEGPMTIVEAQVKAIEAQALMVESSMWLTRAFMKAKIVVTKVR